MTTLQSRTTAASAVRPDRQAPERPVGHTTAWWGMVLFLSSEATTFACLLASYFYVRFADPGPWPPATAPPPELFWSSLETGALVLSCVPMAVAVRAARGGRRGALMVSQVVVWLLGTAFVCFQVLDYVVTYPGSTISEDAFGSLSYTITGLHTVHVIAGLLMVLVLIVSTAVGRLGKRRPQPVGIVALYWYFLAAMSVAVYLVVYISPYW
jgi:cytochrome c oxidase subunit III